MKRARPLGIIVLSVLLSLSIVSCSPKSNLKSIEIEGYGDIKVPEGFSLSVENGFITLSKESSGDVIPVLVQYYNYNDDNVNKLCEDIKELIWLQDEYFSNSAGITKYRVYYDDGSSEELYMLHFTGIDNDEPSGFSKPIELLCLDNSISFETLREIAKSYEMQ